LNASKEESYLVLAATLYSQGESLGAMKVYLNSFAPRDPSDAMVQLAQKYENSGDRKKQQQAKDLKQLGEALRMGREPEPVTTPTAIVQASVDAIPSPTPLPVAPTAPAVAKAVTPPTATPAAQPTQTSAPSAPLTGRGVARPSGANGAIMREQPNTKSAMIGSLANGTNVEIVSVTQGEAVDSAENRWYLVKHENKTGYVYFKLIAGE
jgi:hypothetical protein